MKDLIVSIISAAIEKAHAAGKLKSSGVAASTESPKDPSHGDIASNIALTLARAEGKPPRAIAETIRGHIELPDDVKEATVAGPGFINFRMAPIYWHREMRRAVAEGRDYFRPRKWGLREGGNDTIQVEFLSANPTGPLTVGHGRNAVLGDTIARLYEAAGFIVNREYYFNDGATHWHSRKSRSRTNTPKLSFRICRTEPMQSAYTTTRMTTIIWIPIGSIFR